MADTNLFSYEFDTLLILLEEGARATRERLDHFIEPSQGTLERAKSKRHHLIFGRRGSGKTSLLLRTSGDLGQSHCAAAYIDLERFKGQTYPDVLIGILVETFQNFFKFLSSEDFSPSALLPWWKRLLRISSERADLRERLLEELQQLDQSLRAALGMKDHVMVRIVKEAQRGTESHAGVKSSIMVPQVLNVDVEVDESERRSSRDVHEETVERSKEEYLEQLVLPLATILNEISDFTGRPNFIVLDDFYHITTRDQPNLLDFIHKISKGSRTFLKVGTIRHRSRWYTHGDPPVGMKLGDDAESIDLDQTLEQFSTTRRFLLDVLDEFTNVAVTGSIDSFASEGAVDRLIIASGGVARDFLSIVRKSIDRARERLREDPNHHRGPRIVAEDVNLAAGEHGETKAEEFGQDTQEDRGRLEEEFNRIRAFCIEDANANCFLVDQAAPDEDLAVIDELVDLRLIHRVQPHVTISGKIGKEYKAYMLDLSQYSGQRRRRKLEMVDFWRRGSREQLRRAKLVYK